MENNLENNLENKEKYLKAFFGGSDDNCLKYKERLIIFKILPWQLAYNHIYNDWVEIFV